jgi:hypothetical protein
MQNRVLAVYFSMIRRSAICAVAVMASASSRIINLKAPNPDPDVWGAMEKICLVPAETWSAFPYQIESGIDVTN